MANVNQKHQHPLAHIRARKRMFIQYNQHHIKPLHPTNKLYLWILSNTNNNYLHYQHSMMSNFHFYHKIYS